jgi:hypothetical protein
MEDLELIIKLQCKKKGIHIVQCLKLAFSFMDFVIITFKASNKN